MEASHIDLDYLRRFCKEDRSRMERYVNMYLQGSPGLFQDLLAKVDAGDGDGLAAAAHSLRPQVNYMGAKPLFDLLTTIEMDARSQGASACRDKVLQCLDLNTKVIAELRAWSAQGA